MTLDELKNSLPDYAKDIKLNLTAVLASDGAAGLNQSQIFGIALASAYATQNKDLFSAVEGFIEDSISDEELRAAKASAAIMAMNNIYYRFVHLQSDKSFATMPAKLRMNIIANPGIERKDFELYCLAVSAINGCGLCIDAHSRELQKAEVSKVAIQSAVRIAAVIHAVAATLSLS